MRSKEGLEAVKEMQGKKQWLRQINNASVMIPTIIETLTDRRGFTMEALLNCGAMGCYIDEGFANAKNLPMDHLPRPVPVYNADGSHNEGGPITHTVTLQLRVKDHIEVFPFTVTNTRKTDIIIGFNWLQKHNPNVDWKTGSITFDWCPSEHGIRLMEVEEMEEETQREYDEVEERPHFHDQTP